MSFRYSAGLIGQAPTVVGPVVFVTDGEGGSASGIWSTASQIIKVRSYSRGRQRIKARFSYSTGISETHPTILSLFLLLIFSRSLILVNGASHSPNTSCLNKVIVS